MFIICFFAHDLFNKKGNPCMKIPCETLAAAGYPLLGTPYRSMDCQAFIERCLKDCGWKIDLAGSNAWYRRMQWRGTPEECRQVFGHIPPGAFLFILKEDGKEPEKYRADGLGNAEHIGLKTGKSPGAIHSSASKGKVCESTFRDKSIRGGWNRVGLIPEVSYGKAVDEKLEGSLQENLSSANCGPNPDDKETEPVPVSTGAKTESTGGQAVCRPVTVFADNGYPVKLRKSFNPKSKAYRLWEKIPCGTAGLCLEKRADWCWCQFGTFVGWMMTKFLKF